MTYNTDFAQTEVDTLQVNLSRFNANILFSPNIKLHSLLQYDALSETRGSQSQFRWILRPGNEILFV